MSRAGAILFRLQSARYGLIACLFAALVALAGMWSLPPLDRDEARFAQATVQMLESGDFLVIRFQDRERNKKPAGAYWLQAASVAVFSEPTARAIWAYRLPSAVRMVVAVLFVYLSVKQLFDQRTALLAAMLLSSAPLAAAEATIAKTDSLLLAAICIAQYALLATYARARAHGAKATGWTWPAIFWTAQSIGLLIKGPIAPLISFLTSLGLSAEKPRFAWIKSLRPVSGFVLFAAITAPWAWAINDATDGRFLAEAIGSDMLAKIGSAQERHAGPPGYHFLMVWLLFWPAAALLPAGLIECWRERREWPARFLLSWAIPAWIVFELTATKLPHYVLPVYPALAIIAARAATRNAPPNAPFRRPGALLYAAVTLAWAGVLAATPTYFNEPSIAFLAYGAAGVIAITGLFMTTLFWRGRGFHGGVAASLLAGIFAWASLTGVLPGLSKLSVSSNVSSALETLDLHPLRDSPAPVAIAGYNEPSAVFLMGTQTVLTSGEDAARRLAQGEVGAAIIEKGEEATFQAFLTVAGVAATPLAVVDGLNYSNGKAVSLSIYTLAETDR
ncbi:MAG: ArnT family glycosyltransferase [Hyphococcus sp.]